MDLTPMSFKDYIWPRNPETVTVSRLKNVGSFKIPGAENTLQDLGGGGRTVSGAGGFSGDTCEEEFGKLAAVFAETGAGELLLPGMDPFPALFSSLTRKGDARPSRVSYEFTFLEDGSVPPEESAVSERTVHICAEGDTLFGIAAERGVSVDALLALNLGIEWPNAPGTGTEVAVP